MVYRIFVEKKPGLSNEAGAILSEIHQLLRITSLEKIRLINRYDVENIDEQLFDKCKFTVFAEPQLDNIYDVFEDESAKFIFAVEYLPGQFDQRADSAASCVQIISQKERPLIRTAKIYACYGDLSEDEMRRIKEHLINPVEARQARLDKPDTLAVSYDTPEDVPILNGFCQMKEDELKSFISDNGLAMDEADLEFCINYFKNLKRNPSLTELKVIDTYWSDHCRHTTFGTQFVDVKIDSELIEATWNEYRKDKIELNKGEEPGCLMDIATMGARLLKAKGRLNSLDESDEINACTVKIKVDTPEGSEDWLLLFKNETHNHPTEIEPFGGAATCIGGAIRDPLSGRSYVYAAMRLSGCANPLASAEETMSGKLPQRTITTKAAAGYSSYGNQIGLATGIVDEIYHPGYAAKRMEIGAVLGAAPFENVVRIAPEPGDNIILLGGRTGRDGCGGATGSSKSHTLSSLETCAAEVQKGNPPEERKLQRLFRNPQASKLIKKCNDFGAGGVSVAIGELADGLLIDLDKVPKKYEGLSGTELAISESQERMAVVVSPDDTKRLLELSEEENIEATIVAKVTKEDRLMMSFKGKTIVDLSRDFLNSNGAKKFTDAVINAPKSYAKLLLSGFTDNYVSLAGDLNICSKRGLAERFDSTIGSASILMPFGGKKQLSPIQAMVHKIPVPGLNTTTCSVMAWGLNPYIMEQSPYHGAYISVVESVCKVIAAGGDINNIYLTFQEYFERLGNEAEKWGKPLAALLGAYKAQKDLGIAAIGGKDSMSGSFENIHVPPTLASFAVATGKLEDIVSTDFKSAGSKVVILSPNYDSNNLPCALDMTDNFVKISELIKSKQAKSIYACSYGGAAEAVMKMCLGNGFGFEFSDDLTLEEIFGYSYGSFVIELSDNIPDIGKTLGRVISEEKIVHKSDSIRVENLFNIYEEKLEPVFPAYINKKDDDMQTFTFNSPTKAVSIIKGVKPKVLIPVFPGTNCEYDSLFAMERAGADAHIVVIKNLSASMIEQSIGYFAKELNDTHIVFIPGGFSGGDEPEGSGKFITAFFRSPIVGDALTKMLDARSGLMCGICNGFQALIKLGLVPFGKIIDTDESCPTLTFNTIGRHQSRIVKTRISSNLSPWLAKTTPGQVYSTAISHGEGRFVASTQTIVNMAANGQIATQYVDEKDEATGNILYNPNGSYYAIEGITSPDGRIIGKMGHSERRSEGTYKNVPGDYDNKMFEAAIEFFS